MASADIDQWIPRDVIWEALRHQTAKPFEHAIASTNLGLQLTMASAAGGGEILGRECEDAAGIAFTAASPHTDLDFDRYFLLFVLRGPGTTRLESWDTLHERRIFQDAYALDPTPKIAPHASALLEPGSLILFDGHRLHRAVVDATEKPVVNGLRQVEQHRVGREQSALNAALGSRLIRTPEEPNRLVTACLSLEFKRRPTQEHAESALLAHLKVNAPFAYRDAVAALEPAPALRRRLRP